MVHYDSVSDDGKPPSSKLFTGVSLIVLVLAVVGIAVAAVLLAATMTVAQSLSAKAENIAKNGRGINLATDSVIQLTRTNTIAESILGSAKPLEGQLNTILNHAVAIDQLATSINGTAGTINGTAGTINGTAITINGTANQINADAGSIYSSAFAINDTAKSINATASELLDVAGRIEDDVETINKGLDEVIGHAEGIKSDTGDIRGEAIDAARTSGCIAEKINSVPPTGYNSTTCPDGP